MGGRGRNEKRTRGAVGPRARVPPIIVRSRPDEVRRIGVDRCLIDSLRLGMETLIPRHLSGSGISWAFSGRF